MPQSKLTPEDLYNIYLDTSPKIDQFAENLWNDYFNNSQSDLYLGQSYLEGLKRASIDLKAIGFMFDPNKGNEPLIQNYLQERGGSFITWMTNSQKKEFTIALMDAYTTTGSFEEFKKTLKDNYFNVPNWKALQIWTTENNVAVNRASFDIYDAYKIPGFRTILGPSPCPICITENMYDHRANENVPPYHVYSFLYDVNSEIKDYILLKDKGWTLIYDVEVGDTAFSLNPETKEIEETKITVSYVKPYKGNLIHLYNHDFDVLVTEDHKIVYQSGWDAKHNKDKPYKFKDIKDFSSRDRIPRTGIWKGKEIEKVNIGSLEIDTVTFCKFMGYFLSEGSAKKSGEMVIAQIQKDKKEIMFNDLKHFPLKVTENKNGLYISKVGGEDLFNYLKQFGKSYEKFIPCIIKELTPNLINIFLDAYLLGDGTIQKENTSIVRGLPIKSKKGRKWYTSSKKMADDIGELILKVGNRPAFSIVTKKGRMTTFNREKNYAQNYDVLLVAERTSQYATGQKMKKEIIPFDGFVCGVTLEKNHTIYIKRNGKCSWLSNCQCTTQPILTIENKKDPNAWKQHMTEKEKDRFYKNYEKFNTKAKDIPINLTKQDMKKAIDDILTRRKFEEARLTAPRKDFNPIKDPYNKFADKAVTKLQSKDSLAVREYSSTFKNIQKRLLSEIKGDEYSAYFKDVNEHLKYLDMAMKNNILPDDAILYRGVTEEMAKAFKTPGQVFNHKTFMSTSQSKGQAQYFSIRDIMIKIDKIAEKERRYGDTALYLTDAEKKAAIHTMEIRTPKGTHGLSMKNYTFYGDEQEILLDRGLNLKLIDIKEGYDKVYDKKTYNYIFDVV